MGNNTSELIDLTYKFNPANDYCDINKYLNSEIIYVSNKRYKISVIIPSRINKREIKKCIVKNFLNSIIKSVEQYSFDDVQNKFNQTRQNLEEYSKIFKPPFINDEEEKIKGYPLYVIIDTILYFIDTYKINIIKNILNKKSIDVIFNDLINEKNSFVGGKSKVKSQKTKSKSRKVKTKKTKLRKSKK